MKKYINTGLLCLYCYLSVFSQNKHIPNVINTETIDNVTDQLVGYCRTVDSGYVVTFMNQSSVLGSDFGLAKVDKIGSIKWKKILGKSSSNIEFGKSIFQCPDGGYITAGNSSIKISTGKQNYGLNDFLVVKLDSLGNILWENNYGGSNEDVANCIRPTTDGGYIVAGYSRSTNRDVAGNRGASDYWVIKISSKGTIEWKKSYGGPDISVPGFPSTMMGAGNDVARWIEQANDGGYVLVGETMTGYFSDRGRYPSDVKENHGGFDIWVLKINNRGNIEWQKSIGGSNDEEVKLIKLTKDGGYVVVGQTRSTDGDVKGKSTDDGDGLIVKLDQGGNVQWVSTISVGPQMLTTLSSIEQTSDSSFILSGIERPGDSIFLVSIDSYGKTFWQKKYSRGIVYDLRLNNDLSYSMLSTLVDNGVAKIAFSTLKVPPPPSPNVAKPKQTVPVKKSTGKPPVKKLK